MTVYYYRFMTLIFLCDEIYITEYRHNIIAGIAIQEKGEAGETDEGRNGWGPCQLHPGTHVVCPGCFLPDLTW
ncbi:hypothetical protein SG71_01595 [Enterobacter chengduensis]|uniref:Uncharacterized protein n=1 Tax=Enterobacter chengduensis TaxID=2494701 RepID=A0AAW3HMZ0_9ENTR|nr:hypothetical protein SG71_01595 [Enterobacter chengduensis]